MQFKIGTVTSNADITRTGILKVAFNIQDEENAQEEWVRYVSPFGSDKAAFIALPQPGSTVLCGYSDTPLGGGDTMKGYFYMGSVMGVNPTVGRLVEPGADQVYDETTGEMPLNTQGAQVGGAYTSTQQSEPGVYGPSSRQLEFAELDENARSPFPDVFKGLYDAKGMTPEMMGLTGNRADSMLIHNRYRADSSEGPFQDHLTEIRSGSGKTVRCVDSPIVDGIVIANEHLGKDYIILSTGNSEMSPFAEGELHMRTHGPINICNLESNIHAWVEEGRNIEVENRATGVLSPSGDRNAERTTTEEEGSPPTRVDDYGNEDYGCVKLWSHHNNVSVSALEDNSVIHIHAPGENTKVIVKTGGTVDIVAEKKITLTSDTEVELNAPMVQLNGSTEVEVNAPLVDVNASDRIEEHAANDIQLNAGKIVDIDAEDNIDMDSQRIDLN